MLAAHTIDPENLFTISAGGFSATADAFARDDRTEGLWFVSMVGSQTALKAIWASLLKQPPDTAHLIRGADGMALTGGYQRCVIPYETIGTWTTKIARLPASGGWHALVYTKTAEYAFEKDNFLLLAQSAAEAPALHHRFLDKRSPLPLHDSWAGWLWERGLEEEEIVPLQSAGVFGYRCSPKAKKLREDLSYAVASGRLTLPREETLAAVEATSLIGYRYDDGGRAAAGYRGKTGDCVVRAIAICAREDYRSVYRTMAEHMKRNGYAASGNAYATRERNRKAPRRRGQLNAKRVQDRVLEAYGFRKVRLPAGERLTYTEAHRQYGDCIVGTTKHLAAIVGGALRDTFDGRTYEWDFETRQRKAQSVWVRRLETEE